MRFNYPATRTGSANFDHGSNVVLTATASTGSTAAWTTCPGTISGNGTTTATCTMSNLDGPKTAVATFTLNQYTISGRITRADGSALSNVPVNLSGDASRTTTTDGNGNYTFTGLLNGNYTITPSRPDQTFSPSSRSVTINNANVTGQNFIGTR